MNLKSLFPNLTSNGGPGSGPRKGGGKKSAYVVPPEEKAKREASAATAMKLLAGGMSMRDAIAAADKHHGVTQGSVSIKTEGNLVPARTAVRISKSASVKKGGGSVPHHLAGREGTVTEHLPKLGSVRIKTTEGTHVIMDHGDVFRK